MLRPDSSGGPGPSDLNDYDDNEITPKRGKPDDQLDNRPGPGDDLPERLGERIENGSSSAVAPGEPDVLPDVEPPDTTM